MNVAEMLRRHPFMQGLSDAQIDQLATCTHVVSYPENSFVFREGNQANALYLILSGRVVLEQHVPGKGDVQLENLKGGDIVGLSWLFPGGRWVLNSRAVEPTEMLALESTGVLERMDKDPSLGFALAKQMIHQLYQRLERVRLQRLDIYRGES